MRAALVESSMTAIVGVLWSLLGAVGIALVGLDALNGIRFDGTTASLAIGAVYFGLCLTGGVQLLRKSPGSRVVLLTCAAILIVYSTTFLALVGVEFGTHWTYLALAGVLFGALSVSFMRSIRVASPPSA